jgi:hypothetical protein
LSTQRNIHGIDIYQDYEQKNVYYYSPPELQLQKATSGSPAFILLEMRYTGTHLYGDEQQKGFHNLLQITVELETMPGAIYDEIKNTLGTSHDLKPMPITKFNGELIIPLGDAAAANEKYMKVSMGGVEGAGSGEGHSFWQERTFTMQLGNDEAQLLWDQMETGKLGVSFSYSFYADAIPGKVGEINSSGSNDLADAVNDVREEVTFDDKVNTYLIKSNTFPILISPEDFPNCLKKVDVNEELPPAYAAFEIRCYDFSDDLRPDLLKKIVEIKAYGAGKDFITIKSSFGRNTKDINSRLARFPYAIRLDYPLEYRVIEINSDGEILTQPWIEKKNWAEVIDVTTKADSNPIGKKSIDFESDPDSLAFFGIKSLTCEITYKLNGREINQRLFWSNEENTHIRNLQFSYDLGSPVQFRTITEGPGEQKIRSGYQKIAVRDDYFYLRTW